MHIGRRDRGDIVRELFQKSRWAVKRAAIVLAAAVSVVGVSVIAQPAGAAASLAWGSFALPAGVPDHDYPSNAFAVDGAGFIYYVDNSTGQLTRFSPTTQVATPMSPTNYNGYAGLTVDAAGNVYISRFGTVIEVAPNGASSTVTSSISNPGALAVDSAGHLFVANTISFSGTIYEVSGSTVTTVGTVPTYANSIAVGPDGSIYVADYGNQVFRIKGGVTSTIGSSWQEPESVAVDGQGNVYVATEANTNLWMVSPSGATTDISPTAAPSGAADQIYYMNSTLYYFDSSNEVSNVNTMYVLTPRLLGLSVTGSLSSAGSSLVQGVSATWMPVAGATSYTCRLLFGFNAPSSFTMITSTPSCYFGGLDPASLYGVSVVVNNGSATGAASAFEGRPTWPLTSGKAKHSALCQMGHTSRTKWVTGTNPRCPSGWHRTLLL